MVKLSSIHPSLVSIEQIGFVHGRIIHDNLLLAQELIISIRRKVRRSNTVIKLDISKAYDSLNWLALLRTMRHFGFGERWIDIIWRFLPNCWNSVMINGQSCGFFSSNRGLRQGTPYPLINS